MSTSTTSNTTVANFGSRTSGANLVFIEKDNNSCCYYLDLRTGTIIVGVGNILVSTLLFGWLVA